MTNNSKLKQQKQLTEKELMNITGGIITGYTSPYSKWHWWEWDFSI